MESLEVGTFYKDTFWICDTAEGDAHSHLALSSTAVTIFLLRWHNHTVVLPYQCYIVIAYSCQPSSG